MTESLEQATNIVAGTIQQGFTEVCTIVNEKLKQIKIAIKKQEIIIDTSFFGEAVGIPGLDKCNKRSFGLKSPFDR